MGLSVETMTVMRGMSVMIIMTMIMMMMTRYDGVCDKDGCDYNHWRQGDREYFGVGSNFKVDSSKKMTVVTQFITYDGTDTGC